MTNTKINQPFRNRLATAIRLFTTGFSVLVASSSVLAESNKPDEESVEEVFITGKYTINERIDTATGLGLTLQETPQSVSVITSYRIQDQDLRSLTDIVNNAPGISAKGLDSARQTYSSRGFVIDNYQLDGVPISWIGGGEAGESQSDTSLYERVEVVRGATGLLTGAGNPSASINLVRKHATSEAFSGKASVSAGRWNTHRINTDISSPLNRSGSVRGRLVANYQDGDSFRDLAGDTKSVLYATFDVDATDNTLIRVGASYQDNDPTASTWGGLSSWYSDGTRTDWDRSTTVAANWSSWGSTVENYFAELIHNFGEDWEAKISWNRNVNAADLDLVFLFGVVDRETGLGLGASPYRADTERDQTSVSFQLSGSYELFGRKHDVTFGAIDSHEESVSSSYSRTDVAPVGNFFEWDGNYPQPAWGESSRNVDLETNQFGAYAATRLSLADPVKLIVGARIADWERDGISFGGEESYGDTGVVIPYAGILVDITSEHTFYASYSEIFQAQDLRDRNFNTLDPIIGESREIGLKSRFFDEALHTTITYFDIQQDNLGQADGAPITLENGDMFQPYRGAEGANSSGYELEVVGRILGEWDISFSYTNFTVEDAESEPVNTNQPDELLKLYTTYRFAGALDKLTIAGGVNWQSANYTATNNPFTGDPERLTQDAYSLVSFMARYEFNSDLDIQLNVDNALDETYFNQIGFFNQLEYGEPRDITLSLAYRF